MGRAPVDLGGRSRAGRRVMFGANGAPAASVADAVCASCAIPGVFRPLVLDGRSYVDGGVWSPTNMDRAPARRGTSVLCLNPTGSMRPSRGMPFGAIGLVSRSLAEVEALALRRHGADVSIVAPDAESVEAMGPNLMDAAPARKCDRGGTGAGTRATAIGARPPTAGATPAVAARRQAAPPCAARTDRRRRIRGRMHTGSAAYMARREWCVPNPDTGRPRRPPRS